MPKKKYKNPNRIYKQKILEGRDLNREKVRIRDNHTCQDCGRKWEEGKRRFDVHYLNGLCGKKSKGYDNVFQLDGLVTLCHSCHFNRPEDPINNGTLVVRKIRVQENKCQICEMRLDSEYHKNNPCIKG